MSDFSIRVSEPRPVVWLAWALNIIAGLALLGLMLLTATDVLGRYFFNSPIDGATELTEIGVAIVVFTALPVISWRGESIVVDLFDGLYSVRGALWRQRLIYLISAAAMVFIAQRVLVLGERSLSYGEVTEYLHITKGYVFICMACTMFLTASLQAFAIFTLRITESATHD